MRIDPHGEAFFNERLATGFQLPVADLAVGRRFAPRSDFVYIAPTPRHAGGWPGAVWRVGSLEGVKTQYRTLITADAFVPIERLEPWRSFGEHGRRVVAILDRLARFDEEDCRRVRRRLEKPRSRPIRSARIEVPFSMRAGSPGPAIQAAVQAAVHKTDPTAGDGGSPVDGPETETLGTAVSVWDAFLIVASDAATALFVDGDDERMDRLERRFWRLIEPAS